jgi:hypothetical protein
MAWSQSPLNRHYEERGNCLEPIARHCEERSDEAIQESRVTPGLLRVRSQ